MVFFKNGIGKTLWKKTMTGGFFLTAGKALVRVNLSDSFRSLARLSNFTHLRNLYEKSLDRWMPFLTMR